MKFFRNAHITFVAALATALAFTSARGATPIPGTPGNTGEEAPATETVPVRQPSAWTLSDPLGFHIPASMDTLSYNYQSRFIPSMASDAYATTGNLGAEGLNMIYMDRPERGQFIFARALHHWLPSFGNRKFYNVYVPVTQVAYNYGGNRQNHQDRLQAEFAGNVNRRIGIGAMADYIYSKGSYNSQATKDFSFGFSGYYKGDRYEMQAFYYQSSFLNKENGGITDDLYITDPAVLQGGVTTIEPKSIPTRLTTAHSRLNTSQFYMNHAYKVGYWREEAVNDTLTRDIYIPVTKFLYSFDYRHYKHVFLNSSPSEAEDFWGTAYLSDSFTNDITTLNSFTNTLGVSLIEGFRPWARFALAAYAQIETRTWHQPIWFDVYALSEAPGEDGEDPTANLTPWPQGVVIAPSHHETVARIGGRLEKSQGSILRYNADVVFGLTGSEAGDLDLRGEITTMIPIRSDSLALTAKGRFSNRAPAWLLQQYASNHLVWQNNFGKERRYRVEGELRLDRTRTRIRAGVENIEHMVYFGDNSMPVQNPGHVQVISVALEQRLRAGIFNWDNRLTWQKTTDKWVLPLPQLAWYTNMYLGFTAFRVLDLQIGIDCDYYTRYPGPDYQPATMTFITQRQVDVGNFAFANLYVNARLYKTRFYLLWSHVNQGWFSKGYFSMPHYPVNPRMLQIGLCVDFPE